MGWSPWSGRDSTPPRPAVSCWERPTLPTPSQAPSEAISLFRLDATFAMAQMLWSQPTTRLLSGSSPRSWWPGNQHRRIGSTNRYWSSNLLRGQHIYASFYKIVLEFYLQWLNCPGLKSYLVNLVQFL